MLPIHALCVPRSHVSFFASLLLVVILSGCGGSSDKNSKTEVGLQGNQPSSAKETKDLASAATLQKQSPIVGKAKVGVDNPAEASFQSSERPVLEQSSLFSNVPRPLPNAQVSGTQVPSNGSVDSQSSSGTGLPSAPNVQLKPGSNFAVAPVSFESESSGNEKGRMAPTKDWSKFTDQRLLEENPGKWIQRLSDRAAKFSRSGDSQKELEVWSKIVVAFEEKKVSSQWVETSVRLNKQLAERKTKWSKNQSDAWQKFLFFESELTNLRVQANRLRNQNQNNSKAYQGLLDSMFDGLQKQLVELKTAEFLDTHLAGNVFYEAAATSFARNNFNNALGLAKQAFAVRQKVLGYHPDTVRCLKLCAKIAETAKKDQEATDFYYNAVKLSRKVWGQDHLETADIADQFGMFLLGINNAKASKKKDDFKYCRVWLEESLRIRHKTLGARHILYGKSLRNLGRLQTILATFPNASTTLDLQAADRSYSDAYQIFIENKLSDEILNEFFLEYSAIKSLLGEYEKAEAVIQLVVTSPALQQDPGSLSISAAELYYRWAITCLRQKQMKRLWDGKERLLKSKALSTKDQRSNSDAFRKKVEAALQRVAQLEKQVK